MTPHDSVRNDIYRTVWARDSQARANLTAVPEETMDVEAQIEALNAALRLQSRSDLQYALTAGSMFGFEYQGLAGSLGAFAAAELEDARHLVEKIAALGGDPTADVAAPKYVKDPREAVAC